MKKLILLSLFSLVFFMACNKNSTIDQYEINYAVSLEDDDYTKKIFTCDWDEPREMRRKQLTKYVVEPLVQGQFCTCIISGKVKFIKNDLTEIIIFYDNDGCKNIGYKLICVDGDCEHQDITTCIFEQNCDDGN